MDLGQFWFSIDPLTEGGPLFADLKKKKVDAWVVSG